jgi:RimJ/RimL family protein N-acetyltransferase
MDWVYRELFFVMYRAVPHPYEDGMAEAWINNNTQGWAERQLMTSAIVLKDCLTLIGCISIDCTNDGSPELGFWIGLPYWGSGYCTEACLAFAPIAAKQLGITTIYGRHLEHNPASGKVMENCGFKYINTTTETSGRHAGASLKHYTRVFDAVSTEKIDN